MHPHACFYMPFAYICRINNGLGKDMNIYIYICRWYTLSYPVCCYSITYIAVDIEFPLLLQCMQYISFAVFYLLSPCLFPLPLRAEVNPRSICPLPFSHLGSVFRVLRESSHEGEWVAAGEEKRHTVYPPGTSHKTMEIASFFFVLFSGSIIIGTWWVIIDYRQCYLTCIFKYTHIYICLMYLYIDLNF